ncbi:MAG: hypothetical protein AB2L09_11015 [Coriobacteriia bacterium]
MSQLTNGKAPIAHETAIDLERVLGIEAFWNAAETLHRDLLARQEATADFAEHDDWASSFPLAGLDGIIPFGRFNELNAPSL